MDPKQKRILSLIAFVAVCAVFFFAWAIFNQGEPTEQALAEGNKETKEEMKVEKEVKDFSMSETIALEKEDKNNKEAEVNEETTTEQPTRTEAAPTVPEQIGLGTLKQLGGTVTVKDGGSIGRKSDITMNGWSPNEPFIINGQQFTEGLGFSIDYMTRSNMSIPVVRVPLNGEYTKITGKVGIDDSYIDTASQYLVNFYAQNLDNSITQLYSSDWLSPGNFAVPFELDVTNVPMLIIELVKSDEADEKIKVAIVDTKIE